MILKELETCAERGGIVSEAFFMQAKMWTPTCSPSLVMPSFVFIGSLLALFLFVVQFTGGRITSHHLFVDLSM
jgi:hypothetical protein